MIAATATSSSSHLSLDKRCELAFQRLDYDSSFRKRCTAQARQATSALFGSETPVDPKCLQMAALCRDLDQSELHHLLRGNMGGDVRPVNLYMLLDSLSLDTSWLQKAAKHWDEPLTPEKNLKKRHWWWWSSSILVLLGTAYLTGFSFTGFSFSIKQHLWSNKK